MVIHGLRMKPRMRGAEESRRRFPNSEEKAAARVSLHSRRDLHCLIKSLRFHPRRLSLKKPVAGSRHQHEAPPHAS